MPNHEPDPRSETGPRSEGAGARARLAGLLILVLVCRIATLGAVPIYDDAFITYRYAQNLASGLGMTYNPGAAWEPVLGTTTPGYAGLLGLFALSGAGVPLLSIVLNTLLDLGSVVLLFRLLAGRPAAQVATVVVFAGLPHLARISAGGMEAPLLAFLALAASLAFTRRRYVLAGFCAALACTVRPESVLLVGLLSLGVLRRPKDLARLLVPVAVVGFTTVGVLTAIYDSPIPHSVTAKSATHSAKSTELSLYRIEATLRQAFLPTVMLLPVLPVVLLGMGRALRERCGARWFTAFALAITASYVAARPHTWGWYYYVPLVAWSIGLGLGVDALLRLGPLTRLQALFRGPLLAASLVLVGAGVVAVTRLMPDKVTSDIYAPMWAWMEAEGLDAEDVTVLASDIGAVGWGTRGRVLDSEGLVWPDALDVLRGQSVHKAQMDLVETWEPDYVMLVCERGRMEALLGRPDVAARYEPVARFNKTGDTDLRPDPASLPNAWRQDYLFLRRR